MDPSFDPRPVILEGHDVVLRPLTEDDASALFQSIRDDPNWRYMPREPFKSIEDAREWIRRALDSAGKTEIVFAIETLPIERVVGSTRYLDIRREDRGLEIGWTWIDKSHRRTVINTECKYLLLQHAFEDLGAARVQLKTDLRNEGAQRAIERLGATREGILRKHRRLWDGFIRDTVYYSILDSEWPRVRLRLERFLKHPGSTRAFSKSATRKRSQSGRSPPREPSS